MSSRPQRVLDCTALLLACAASLGCHKHAGPGPEPTLPFPESEAEQHQLDDFEANLVVTARIEREALRRPPLQEMVDAQIAAMLAHARAHGRGELHEPSLSAVRAPARTSRDELRRLATAAVHLFAHLDYDTGPSELSRVAFAALAEKLPGVAVYEPVGAEEGVKAGSDLSIAYRDGIGLIALRHLDDTMADRVAAVLGQWAGAERPPRAVVLDLSRCEFASPNAAAALVNTFAPGRTAFALESREPDGSEIRREPFQGDANWGSDVYANAPLFVLVSEGTSSVAEAMTHALRHHRTARVLGTPTRGDGRLMVWFGLPGARFGFTIAELYGLDGEPLRGRPVIPDACLGASGIVALAPRTAGEFRARCTGAELARDAALDHVRGLLAAEGEPAPEPALEPASEHGRVES